MSVNRSVMAAPLWSGHNRWLRSTIPVSLRSWLLDPASLTDRLKKTCSGCFSVRVLNEAWQRPRLDEVRVLSMKTSTVAWVREVQLLCDGHPWVFARTVIPITTLTGSQRLLTHLGNRPLGAYLFTHPGMRRGRVELARIRQGQAMFTEANAGVDENMQEIWGRRSVFRLTGKPLLVAEMFLPALSKNRKQT